MENMTLAKIHMCVRYKKNINNIVNLLDEIYNSLNKWINNEESKNINFQNSLKALFEEIKNGSEENYSEFLGENPELLVDFCKKFSFQNYFENMNIDQETLETMDFLSARISDFELIFSRGIDRETNGLISTWKVRSPELFFRQKGQLWLLNFVNNLLFNKDLSIDYENDNSKIIIRDLLDRQFSPYPYGVDDNLIKRQINEIKKHREDHKNFEGFKSPVQSLERKMGFELEHQIPCDSANSIFNQEQGEDKLLEMAKNLYHGSECEILEKVVSGFKVGSSYVIENGSLTRDASNVRRENYISCEYSSPVGNLDQLKENASQLCSLLEKNGGGLVREDCGTHIHVSIEDLHEKESDDEEIKKLKLNALKRIFVNYILLRKDFEKLLPEYRRGDNSMYSGQAHSSFVGWDDDFIIGLVNSCNSYQEIQDTLLIGGKYLSLVPFKNTVEFRNFPAQTNSEVFAKWFELVNSFVQNCIEGISLEECINKDIVKSLKELCGSDLNGIKVHGMQDNDTMGICFRANSFDKSDFYVISPNCVEPLDLSKKEEDFIELFESSPRFSNSQMCSNDNNFVSELLDNLTRYAQQVQRCIHRLDYCPIVNMSHSLVGMNGIDSFATFQESEKRVSQPYIDKATVHLTEKCLVKQNSSTNFLGVFG